MRGSLQALYQAKIIQDDCIGRGCANVSPSASYGILGNVDFFIACHVKFLCYMLGYKTCSSLLNETANMDLQTSEGADPLIIFISIIVLS